MLLYIKQLLLKGQGVQEDELQSMLNYLCTLHEVNTFVKICRFSVWGYSGFALLHLLVCLSFSICLLYKIKKVTPPPPITFTNLNY